MEVIMILTKNYGTYSSVIRYINTAFVSQDAVWDSSIACNAEPGKTICFVSQQGPASANISIFCWVFLSSFTSNFGASLYAVLSIVALRIDVYGT